MSAAAKECPDCPYNMIRGEGNWFCTKCGHMEPAPSLLAELDRLRVEVEALRAGHPCAACNAERKKAISEVEALRVQAESFGHVVNRQDATIAAWREDANRLAPFVDQLLDHLQTMAEMRPPVAALAAHRLLTDREPPNAG